MKLPKVVIFDLGDTLVRNLDFNFEKGLKYLFDEVIVSKPEYEDFLSFNSDLKKQTYDKRNITNLEVKFLDYLNILQSVYGFKNKSLLEVEAVFMEKATTDRLYSDVKLILDFFKSKNINLYVLSNSTFSTETLRKQLEKYNILNYFEKIFSSADYLLRKPHFGIFEIVKKYVNRTLEIKEEETWFIGNDYECDIIGSNGAGFVSIWLNENEKTKQDQLAYLVISNYKELYDKLINL